MMPAGVRCALCGDKGRGGRAVRAGQEKVGRILHYTATVRAGVHYAATVSAGVHYAATNALVTGLSELGRKR